MKKGFLAILTAAAVILLVFISAHSQEEMTFVDNRVYDNPSRVSTVFNHEAHNEAAGLDDCAECHHIYENGQKLEDETSEDQACSECHDTKGSAGNLPLTKAYHTNCKGCHMNEKAGPVMCGECHQK